MTMGSADHGHRGESYPQAFGAEEAFRTGQRVEQARRDARSAQRSAAQSLDKSADSHVRTATSYDEAAKHSVLSRDEYQQHAARHREIAREDRRMAERLRRMAEGGPVGDAGE
jgi:hypothetical protein